MGCCQSDSDDTAQQTDVMAIVPVDMIVFHHPLDVDEDRERARRDMLMFTPTSRVSNEGSRRSNREVSVDGGLTPSVGNLSFAPSGATLTVPQRTYSLPFVDSSDFPREQTADAPIFSSSMASAGTHDASPRSLGSAVQIVHPRSSSFGSYRRRTSQRVRSNPHLSRRQTDMMPTEDRSEPTPNFVGEWLLEVTMDGDAPLPEAHAVGDAVAPGLMMTPPQERELPLPPLRL